MQNARQDGNFILLTISSHVYSGREINQWNIELPSKFVISRPKYINFASCYQGTNGALTRQPSRLEFRITSFNLEGYKTSFYI